MYDFIAFVVSVLIRMLAMVLLIAVSCFLYNHGYTFAGDVVAGLTFAWAITIIVFIIKAMMER